jgi:uncharacterized phage protein (TIGR01671 family)
MLNIRLYDNDVGRMIYHNKPINQGKREYYPYEFRIGFSYFKPENLILMYGSGITDKNNREIYENDILEVNIKWFYKSFIVNYECVFKNGAFWLKNKKSQYHLHLIKTTKKFNDVTIIGNIYEI